MDIGAILYVTTREEWREWLRVHFRDVPEIWLVFPNKTSGKERISYNDAVEEALCFGWIDSTIKKLDKNNSVQRFSPRNPKSGFSQLNKERLAWLLKKRMIHPSLEVRIKQSISEKFIFPRDIINEIKKDKVAWKNFQSFSESYRRIRVAYIDGARSRPDEFQKRLSYFLVKTRKNKQIKAFGGSEKYY